MTEILPSQASERGRLRLQFSTAVGYCNVKDAGQCLATGSGPES